MKEIYLVWRHTWYDGDNRSLNEAINDMLDCPNLEDNLLEHLYTFETIEKAKDFINVNAGELDKRYRKEAEDDLDYEDDQKITFYKCYNCRDKTFYLFSDGDDEYGIDILYMVKRLQLQ